MQNWFPKGGSDETPRQYLPHGGNNTYPELRSRRPTRERRGSFIAGSTVSLVGKSAAFAAVMAGEGEFQEKDGLRRYRFDGFDILIRSDQVPVRR
jgi:hypothetical protein